MLVTTVPCPSEEYLKLAAPSPQLYAGAFADAAYEETVLRSATAAGERIGTAYSKYPAMADHFLYGSDWSLLITQGKNDVYLKNFISQMKHLDAPRKPGDPLSISQRFFGWNAVTYAGLTADTATRKRLDAFYVKNNVSKPLWAQKVDNRANT